MQQETVHGSGVAPACLARLSSSSVKRNKHIISISVGRENMEKELTPQFTVTQLVKKLPVFVESVCSQESSTGNYARLLNPLNIIRTLFFEIHSNIILKMEVTWAKIMEACILLGQINLIFKILNISRVRFWHWICWTDESSGSNSKSYIYCDYQYFGPTVLQTVQWCSTNWRQNAMIAINGESGEIRKQTVYVKVVCTWLA